MYKTLNILAFFIFLTTLGVQAQVILDNSKLPTPTLDSLHSDPRLFGVPDTITTDTLIADSLGIDTLATNEFKPDPVKVVWMAAIIPGYGQIMNKKYWKLPLVYGGFLGCAYAITWNGIRYQAYKTAYRDIIDTDLTTNSHIEILPRGYTVESIGGEATYTNVLKTGQDAFRRYRDLSIIATIGYYAITIIDAYVDAQLYDFDISPDLSLRFQPTLLSNGSGLPNALGMQCSFRFK